MAAFGSDRADQILKNIEASVEHQRARGQGNTLGRMLLGLEMEDRSKVLDCVTLQLPRPELAMAAMQGSAWGADDDWVSLVVQCENLQLYGRLTFLCALSLSSF